MRLKDKVAIVTGGGSGIGAATCKLFAKEDAKVVVADMDEPAAERIANDIKKEGGQAVAARMDVTRKEEVDRVIKNTLTQWGKIDILIHCAGIGEMEWFIDGKENTWDQLIEVNLKGTIIVNHAVLPGMIERKYGKIVNIASAAGKTGAGTQAVYSGTKGGVDSFSKALAREVARYGINVNTVCPGPIDTPMWRRFSDTKIAQAIVRGTAFKRLGKPEEIATAALFLASEEASYITGHSLLVDGGATMI